MARLSIQPERADSGHHMSPAVQDDVVTLAGRMLDMSHAKSLSVTWFGGSRCLRPT